VGLLLEFVARSRSHEVLHPIHCGFDEDFGDALHFVDNPNIARFLHHVADVHAVSDMGRTPLHVSTQTGRLDMVKLLLDGGALVDMKRRLGLTPLHYATL
jgi:ankyrin repeat protein